MLQEAICTWMLWRTLVGDLNQLLSYWGLWYPRKDCSFSRPIQEHCLCCQKTCWISVPCALYHLLTSPPEPSPCKPCLVDITSSLALPNSRPASLTATILLLGLPSGMCVHSVATVLRVNAGLSSKKQMFKITLSDSCRRYSQYWAQPPKPHQPPGAKTAPPTHV